MPTSWRRARARRSSARRTASSVPARTSASSSSPRPATRMRSRRPQGAFGGFGGLFKLSQRHPSDDDGSLTLFFRGDVAHTGFDNIQFWSKDKLVSVEDGGDTLHTQRNALDSAYMFDVRKDYSDPANQPIRILAQGRDPSATIDAGAPGLGNDGDNEITGFHVSNGDPSVGGIPRGQEPAAVRGRLARLLHPAARRQRDVGDHSESVDGRGRAHARPRRRRPRLAPERQDGGGAPAPPPAPQRPAVNAIILLAERR